MADQQVGFLIRDISHTIRRTIHFAINKKLGSEYQLTHIQNAFLMKIYNSEDDVCQKDLENKFKVGASTTTQILQTLEKNGLIERRVSPKDKRFKTIKLTDEGIRVHLTVIEAVNDVEERIMENICEDDLIIIRKVFDQIKENCEVIINDQ